MQHRVNDTNGLSTLEAAAGSPETTSVPKKAGTRQESANFIRINGFETSQLQTEFEICFKSP
jgi:hypothetical protein